MNPRPFYLIAHRCNDVDVAVEKISDGANAIEIDIQHKDGEFYVNHDIPSGSLLGDFLVTLMSRVGTKSEFAMIIYDCKDIDFEINTLLKKINAALTSVSAKPFTLISIAKLEDKDFFKGVSYSNNSTGVSIDESNEVDQVESFFKTNSITHYCYGNGIFVAGIGPNVYRTVSQAVFKSSEGGSFKLVYVWTLAKKESMRDYLWMGVDGVFVNDVKALVEVLNEDEFNERIFLATRAHNPYRYVKKYAVYQLTVYTKDISHGGTDANLKFVLEGENGTVSAVIDSKPVGMMEAGDTNYVVLEGENIGQVKTLTVSRDNSGNAPDWFLDRISVKGTGIQNPIDFVFDEWIPESGITKSPNTMTYHFEVRTGNVLHAGTDALVTFKLFGDSITETTVDGNQSGVFEQNTTHNFDLFGKDIGAIKTLSMSRNNSGNAPDWYLDYVKITKKKTGSGTVKESLFFAFNEWIPEVGDSRNPQTDYTLEVKTSGESSSGTDANLTFRIFDTSGQEMGAMTVDTYSKGICETGDNNKFQMGGQYSANIHKMSIYNDNAGNGPDWRVDWIKVTCKDPQNNGKEWTFQINAWVDGNTTRDVTVS